MKANDTQGLETLWKAVLHGCTTAELVAELKHRPGVMHKEVEPYQDLKFKVNGPAIVLIVTD